MLAYMLSIHNISTCNQTEVEVHELPNWKEEIPAFTIVQAGLKNPQYHFLLQRNILWKMPHHWDEDTGQ